MIQTVTLQLFSCMTQEYIRKLKPTRYERRKLREHVRNGGRFRIPHVFMNEMVDFITENYETHAKKIRRMAEKQQE